MATSIEIEAKATTDEERL